uniref:Glutathione peroxidase n=1 Tax=Amphiprion percula TaxID=161767 RepID=A0A3P8TYW9_AMPPE
AGDAGISALPLQCIAESRLAAINKWDQLHFSFRRTSMANKSIYDFSAETLDGQPVPLSNYRGKVLLIVNVATF